MAEEFGLTSDLVARTVRSPKEAMVVFGLALDGIQMVVTAKILAREVRGLAAVAEALSRARAAAHDCPSVSAAEALVLHALDGGFERADGVRRQLCEIAASVCLNATKADDYADVHRAYAREFAAACATSALLPTRQTAVLEAMISARALDLVESVIEGVRNLVLARAERTPAAVALLLQRAAGHLSCEQRITPLDGQLRRENASTRGMPLAAVLEAVAAGALPLPSLERDGPTGETDGAESNGVPSAQALLAEAERLAQLQPHAHYHTRMDAHGGSAIVGLSGLCADRAAAAVADAARTGPEGAGGGGGAAEGQAGSWCGEEGRGRAAAAYSAHAHKLAPSSRSQLQPREQTHAMEAGADDVPDLRRGDGAAQKRSRTNAGGGAGSIERRPLSANAHASSSESPRAPNGSEQDPISTVTPTPPSAAKPPKPPKESISPE